MNIVHLKISILSSMLILAAAGYSPTVIVGQAPDTVASAAIPTKATRPFDNNGLTAIEPTRRAIDTLHHLSLDNAIDLLEQKNLSVIAARYNVNLAQAQKIVAGLRPAASVTISVNQLTIPRLLRTPSEFYSTNGNAAANATYTVEYDRLWERGDKRNLRISQAEILSQAAETQVKDTLRQQIGQLKQAFLSALLARENLRVAMENYGSFNVSQNILASQVSEGYAAGVDLKRIELQKLTFQRDISNSEQTFQQSIRDVYNLIGMGDNVSIVDDLKPVSYDSTSFIPQIKQSLEILEGSLDVDPMLLSISDLRRLAIENRPDVKTAEMNLAAATAGLKLAEAQHTRDITVGIQYMRSGGDNAVGAVATIPLDVKKRADLAQAQAQINIKIAETQLRQAQNQAVTDVEKAFTAYMISRERLRLFNDRSLAIARDVRRVEEASYHDGVKSLLDYLDAQHIYNQTITDYNQSRYDYLLSLTQLESAVGTKLPLK